jgi:hypothetical protein
VTHAGPTDRAACVAGWKAARSFFVAGGLATAIAALPLRAQTTRAYERPPINYSKTKPNDAVARLAQRIAKKEIVLAGSDQEILCAVLHELGIPVESQITVFSKTSLQTAYITAANPRAIYFSDSIYVAWVPGGLMEVAAIDPQLGPIFYSFDPKDARDARRSFVRESSCLRCHGTPTPNAIPELFARSTRTTIRGDVLGREDEGYLGDEVPFEQRWGGWYVTGYSGKLNHRGNAFSVDHDGKSEFTPSEKRPVDLHDFLDATKYLTTTSDVVALLVFQHQLAMHNSLTLAAHSYRRATEEERTQPALAAKTAETLAVAAQDVVDHLLFRHAAPLPAGLTGNAAFRSAFLANGPRTRSGASLRELSLQGNLLANRCSYLIYSESFQALPSPLKSRIFDLLCAALSSDDATARYAYLPKAEKQRIAAILSETLPEARERLGTSVHLNVSR